MMHPTIRQLILLTLQVASLCVVAMALAVGCQTTPNAQMPGTMNPPDMPGPTAAKLFTLISQTDPYPQWGQFPDRQGTLPSVLPHGPMSRVWINGKVESALGNFTGQLPDGSIIVKENVGTSSQVTEAALTVMWKVAGFDPVNNDWFWANMSSDGQIMAEGKVQSCTLCHGGGARNNDFVFVHRF
jgi:hypothetical protein